MLKGVITPYLGHIDPEKSSDADLSDWPAPPRYACCHHLRGLSHCRAQRRQIERIDTTSPACLAGNITQINHLKFLTLRAKLIVIMTSPPIRRVAVIGAGVSGVLTAAHLKSEGLDVTVFERAPVSGGVWCVLYPDR